MSTRLSRRYSNLGFSGLSNFGVGSGGVSLPRFSETSKTENTIRPPSESSHRTESSVREAADSQGALADRTGPTQRINEISAVADRVRRLSKRIAESDIFTIAPPADVKSDSAEVREPGSKPLEGNLPFANRLATLPEAAAEASPQTENLGTRDTKPATDFDVEAEVAQVHAIMKDTLSVFMAEKQDTKAKLAALAARVGVCEDSGMKKEPKNTTQLSHTSAEVRAAVREELEQMLQTRHSQLLREVDSRLVRAHRDMEAQCGQLCDTAVAHLERKVRRWLSDAQPSQLYQQPAPQHGVNAAAAEDSGSSESPAFFASSGVSEADVKRTSEATDNLGLRIAACEEGMEALETVVKDLTRSMANLQKRVGHMGVHLADGLRLLSLEGRQHRSEMEKALKRLKHEGETQVSDLAALKAYVERSHAGTAEVLETLARCLPEVRDVAAAAALS